MESSTRSKAQQLKFWLFSDTRAQVWCESFTQVSKPELCGSTGGRVLQTLSASTFLLLTWSNSCGLPGAVGKHALRHMKCYISSGEGKGWLGCMDLLCRPGDCTAKPSWHLLKVAKLFTAIISLSPHSKKKGRAQHWSSFQRMVCFISPQCSSAFGENVAVVLLKNNKSYGIPLNWANVGSVGRRDTERFKVLV